MTNLYQKAIQKRIARLGLVGMDTRHVEAWMRSSRPTFDALSPAEFEAEVHMAVLSTLGADAHTNEALAKSYGL